VSSLFVIALAVLSPTVAAVAVPHEYHGTYDSTPDSCESDSDMKLTITATTLEFYESTGTVKSIVRHKDSSITVMSEFEGEGEKWMAMDHLRLSYDDRVLTITHPVEQGLEQFDTDRVRCPGKPRK
jgi:hypothetical protein